jgi:hypothetical protein
MSSRALSILFLSAFWFGCTNPADDKRENLVAQVGAHSLYLNQVLDKVGDNINSGDSLAVVNEFVQQWIREKVLLDKAEASLTPEERDKNDLVTQYYNDLLIYELERKMLSSRLDTAVAVQSITEYYEKNKKNFELKENIVRLKFYVIPKTVLNHDLLWKRFKDGNDKHLALLDKMCELNNSNYFNQDSVWLTFNDVLKEIPITTYNQESYLNNHRFVRLDEKDYSYFVKILDFKVKNNTSPFEFEKERIRDIIIHKRKVELLQQIEIEIVEEAYRNNKIEKF